MEKIKYIGNNLSYIIEKKRTPKCQKKKRLFKFTCVLILTFFLNCMHAFIHNKKSITFLFYFCNNNYIYTNRNSILHDIDKLMLFFC